MDLSLAAFGRDDGRTSIEGEDVSISLETAGSLGLVLHELATNAVRHGALSVATGCVRVTWSRTNGDLAFVWRESGGPSVSTPTRQGFGTVLIGQSIPHEIGGSAELDFAPEGVVCTITFPIAAG